MIMHEHQGAGARLLRPLLAAGVGMLAAGVAPSLAQDSRASNIQLFAGNQGGDKAWIGDTELMKAFRDELGGRYSNLHIVMAACESEGFAREGKRLLGGNFSVAAARDYDSSWEFRTNVFRQVEGKTGLNISTVQYAHGWGPQYFRAISDNRDRTAQQLFDFAKANDYFRDANTARFESGGSGNASSIRPGELGGMIALVQPEKITRIADQYIPETADSILKHAGYANETILHAYAQSQGQSVLGVPIDFSASKAALFGESGIIASMKDYLDALKGGVRTSAFIFDTHGASERRRAERKPDAVPNQPRQGKSVTPGGTGGPMALDPSDVHGFFDDFLEDDPFLDRLDGSRPTIFLTTSEEEYAGPVQVLLDGVPVGEIEMLGSSLGASYQLQFDDAAWTSVHAARVLDDLFVEISFNFAGGSFRIATEWDQEIFDLDRFGVGLSKPAIYGIPAPGSLAVLGLGLIAAARRRRR